MSERCPNRPHGSTNMSAPSESSGSGDDVDPESEDFDSLQALYSKKAFPPCKNVRVYDNVQQYESYIKAAQQGTLRQRLQRQQASRQKHQAGAVAEAAASGQSVSAAGPSSGPGAVSSDGRQTASGPATSTVGGAVAEKRYIVPGRRFTEDQAPVARLRKAQRSVITRMEAAEPGPCGRLRWCMERRVKVKVYIRNFGRLRGVCTGYIVAFDKHWNLCLEDVDEVYQRKVRRKSCFLGDPDSVPYHFQPDAADTAAGQVSDPRRPTGETRSPSPGRPADPPADRKPRTAAAARSRSSRPGSEQTSDRASGTDPGRRRPAAAAAAAAADDPEVARLTARFALLEPPRSRRAQRRPVYETLRRHVSQLFVRGDNVVLVAVEGGGGAGDQQTSDDDVREVPDDDVKVIAAVGKGAA